MYVSLRRKSRNHFRKRERNVPSFVFNGAMELTERIQQLLEEKYATDENFADCFTVEIELKPSSRLYVFIDSDSNMDFEKCRKISRYLEEYIDTNGWLGEKYLLEVSSPGLGRPLKFLRQYVKNISRTVEITLTDKNRHVGILHSADENQVVIRQTITERDEKKKKVTKEVELALPFDQIDKTIVKPVF
jgi:ribosome maturation factor RimP